MSINAQALAIPNAMSVDVEDYFQVSAFESTIHRQDWENIECRVEANTQKILQLFADKHIKATFFTLGWVAERYPQLVHEIVNQGHELACHGQEHKRVTQQTPDEFRDDIVRSKATLEQLSGKQVIGYRAASYSVTDQTYWALKILDECGFKYSSSVYPIKHDLYGIPEAPRFAYKPFENSDFIEIPISSLRFGSRNFPCGGGGYFRLFPYALSKMAIRRLNKSQHSALFYFHPWEVDPQQPRQKNISLKTRFRHYLNLSRMQDRLEMLADDFHWDTMEQVFLARGVSTPHINYVPAS